IPEPAETGRKETSQPKSNWDKRARKYPNRPNQPKRDKSAQKQLGQVGQKYLNRPETGRNCPKRSKIKIGRPGKKDPKYAKKPKEPKANQKVPRVFGPNEGQGSPFRADRRFLSQVALGHPGTRMDTKYAEDPAGPRNIEKISTCPHRVKVRKVKGRIFEHRSEQIGSCHVSHLRTHKKNSKEIQPKSRGERIIQRIRARHVSSKWQSVGRNSKIRFRLFRVLNLQIDISLDPKIGFT
ncbi:hypothetical protein KI387_006101, partial [Taxus chinensis]